MGLVKKKQLRETACKKIKVFCSDNHIFVQYTGLCLKGHSREDTSFGSKYRESI